MDISIRSWKMTDAAMLAKLLNNKKIHDNLRDGLPFPYTVSDGEQFIQSMLEADKSHVFAWAITAEDKVVGSIGVFRQGNIHRLTAELGYYLGEDHWGKGIATEAVRQVVAFIFKETDILRLFAEPFAHNKGSCRVLEKAGFVCEGVLKNNAIKNGQVEDMKMYACVSSE